ncbi:MAG: Ig-like domain-containing protein, partial [Acidimicrobiales bacterium]
TYTPNADYNGPDSFTYTVCDTSTACTTATITITVTAVNDRPTAQPASASTGEKAPVDVQLSGQDRDGDGLTYAIVTPPGGGTVSVVAATGLATYTPAPGHGGVDTFTYTVSDGTTTSASATVTVTTVLGSDGTYFPVSPHRLLDTRVATGTSSRTRVGSGQTIAVQVAGVAGSGLPATGIAAVSINLTATEATGNGYLVAHASGTPRPPSSNVNYVTAASVPNAAIVPVGADGKVLIFNTGSSVHLVVDVVGWYSGPGRAPGSRLQVLPPARLLDTRTPGLGPIGSNSTLDVQVTGVPGTGVPATGVAAVVMNLTQAGNDQGGWMTVYPTGEARQYTSSLNFAPGDIDPNMVVSKVGTGGKVSIYNLQGNAHVIIDILGYYTDPGGSGGRFVSIAAERLADTRSPVGGGAATPIGAGQTIAVGVAGVPGSAIPSIGQDGTTGVVANITVASTTIGGYLTVYPSGDARQGTSTLNMTPNQVVPNMTITKVGEGGRISIYNDLGQTNVIVDVVGYFRF